MAAMLGLAVFLICCIYTYYNNRDAPRGRFVARRFWLDHEVYTVASAWLRWTRLYPFTIVRLPQLVRYCALVFEKGDDMPDPAFAWSVQAFACSVVSLFGVMLAFLAKADISIVLLLATLALFLPVIQWRELSGKVKRRQEAFIAELPTFIHKLSLLIAAGETVQRAWVRAGIADESRTNHPLYVELARTSVELSQGVPFTKALEDLHRRCGIHEMSSLTTTVLMNFRRGGDAFALALQDASRQLMERKYALVRTSGEEASTKLLLPMMLMLGAVMLIVAAPAVMLMQ